MQKIEDLLNLSGIQINDIEIIDNNVIIKCSSIFNECICPRCKKKSQRIPKYYIRTIRDLEIFGKHWQTLADFGKPWVGATI